MILNFLAAVLLVPQVQAQEPLDTWLINCHVTSRESPWYSKLIEARRRVLSESALQWNDETCEVTVPEGLQKKVAFCDVDVPGSPDRGIGEVATRESCALDARLDHIGGLATQVSKARKAAEEAQRQAVLAQEESRDARARADDAAGSAFRASVDASEARAAAQDAQRAVEEARALVLQAAQDTQEARRVSAEALTRSGLAQEDAQVATKLARRALTSGGYFLVVGGGHALIRNEVVVPYGKDGVLSEGYDPSQLVDTRTIRTNGAGGVLVGFDGGYAWPGVRVGIQVHGLWSAEQGQDERFRPQETNGFGGSLDLHADIARGSFLVGGGPTLVGMMYGQEPTSTPALTSYVLGGMLSVSYHTVMDRRSQTAGLQVRVGKETFNSTLQDYEQSFDAPWAQIALVIGLGGAPEPPLKEK
jgi:hypothetical protein